VNKENNKKRNKENFCAYVRTPGYILELGHSGPRYKCSVKLET